MEFKSKDVRGSPFEMLPALNNATRSVVVKRNLDIQFKVQKVLYLNYCLKCIKIIEIIEN